MTDYTKLIEEACSTAAKYELENYYGTSKDYTAMCKVEAEESQRALQSAIAALQGEVERLDRETADLAMLADRYKAERDKLQAENERLKAEEEAAKEVFGQIVDQKRDLEKRLVTVSETITSQQQVIVQFRKERDTLQAKLNELQRQEPVGFMSPKQLELIQDAEGEHGHYIPMRKTPIGLLTMPLYAAPKALTLPERWKFLYTAVNNLLVFIGREGSVSSDSSSINTLSNAMHDIDGGTLLDDAAPKAMEPLTEEQLDEGQLDYVHSTADFKAGARFAEKHHGITKGTP